MKIRKKGDRESERERKVIYSPQTSCEDKSQSILRKV